MEEDSNGITEIANKSKAITTVQGPGDAIIIITKDQITHTDLKGIMIRKVKITQTHTRLRTSLTTTVVMIHIQVYIQMTIMILMNLITPVMKIIQIASLMKHNPLKLTAICSKINKETTKKSPQLLFKINVGLQIQS